MCTPESWVRKFFTPLGECLCLMFAFIPFSNFLDGDSESWFGFGRSFCKLDYL